MQSNDGTTASLTQHTTGSDDNRIPIVGTGTSELAQYMSLMPGNSRTDYRHNGDVRSELWYLLNPPTGTHDLVIQFSGIQNLGAGAITYSGVDQEDPIYVQGETDTSRWLNEATTSLTQTIENAEGGVVVGTIALQSRNTTLLSDQSIQLSPSVSSAGVLNMSDIFGSGEKF